MSSVENIAIQFWQLNKTKSSGISARECVFRVEQRLNYQCNLLITHAFMSVNFSAKDGHLSEIAASELAEIDRYRRNLKPGANKRE